MSNYNADNNTNTTNIAKEIFKDKKPDGLYYDYQDVKVIFLQSYIQLTCYPNFMSWKSA